MKNAWILTGAAVCGALMPLCDTQAQEPSAAAHGALVATPPTEAAAERVADVYRSLFLKNGATCRVRIEVLRLPDKRIRVLVQDESPAATRGLLRCQAQSFVLKTNPFDIRPNPFEIQAQPDFTPLRADACGMGEYEAAAPPEGCFLSYSIDCADDEDSIADEENSGDDEISLLSTRSITGEIPLTPMRCEPEETGRPGCWDDRAEFPTEAVKPAAPLPPPAAADCVSDMVVDVPLPDGTLGKLQASIYRQTGGFLFITKDVTPGAPAPFYISDISFGLSKSKDGSASIVIGPGYNGYFTPQQTTRRGIGRFFLADERIAAYHPKCIALSFEFRVCDAEGRKLTSFSAEVDMEPGSEAAE